MPLLFSVKRDTIKKYLYKKLFITQYTKVLLATVIELQKIYIFVGISKKTPGICKSFSIFVKRLFKPKVSV